MGNEFLVMPFGLTDAPSTFQSLINDIFKPVLRKYVLVLFDIILIYSREWRTHLEHLREILVILNKHQLVANQKKCHFGRKSWSIWVNIISAEGVDPGNPFHKM